MYLTDLADVLRKAGLQVVEVPGWQTRGRPGGMIDVRTIICHHTGGLNDLDTIKNGRSDLPGPLAQFWLARTGVWYVVAAGKCNHAGQSRSPNYTNSHAIGVEAEALGTGVASDWPDVQMSSYVRGVDALRRHYNVPMSNVLGHKETCAPVGRKSDPSFSMPAFRNRVLHADQEVTDMPLNADDKAWVTATLTSIVRAEVAKVAPAVWRQPLTNGHDKTTAQAAAWVVYGNEASHAAVDAARSSATDSAAAVRAAILAGTVKVDISVNGAPQ